jgi:hypothetical protein
MIPSRPATPAPCGNAGLPLKPGETSVPSFACACVARSTALLVRSCPCKEDS